MEEGKELLYLTKRAVFKLTPSGVEPVEEALGVNLERDTLGKMEFRLVI